MQLELELRTAITALKKLTPSALGGRTAISLGSGCDLFMKYVSRAFLEYTVRSVCALTLIRMLLLPVLKEFHTCKEELYK